MVQFMETQGMVLLFFEDVHPEIGETIQKDKVLTDELRQQILNVAGEFLEQAK